MSYRQPHCEDVAVFFYKCAPGAKSRAGRVLYKWDMLAIKIGKKKKIRKYLLHSQTRTKLLEVTEKFWIKKKKKLENYGLRNNIQFTIEYIQDIDMSDETEPHGISGHVAVRLGQYILAFGGEDANGKPVSTYIIWMYNLYTEKWKKYEIPCSLEAPPRFYREKFAVAIGSDVYMFDGRTYSSPSPDDALWVLTTGLKGNIHWNRIISNSTPPYRLLHSGWEYEGTMWIFGGFVASMRGCNNELLCFNPSTNEWTKPKCFGSVPSPRGGHATTRVQDKVFLFGGINRGGDLDDLFELDMSSLTWTEIPTTQPWPEEMITFSLTVITESKLLLHGVTVKAIMQSCEKKLTWILDLPSQSWKQCSTFKEANELRRNHAGTTGLNNCVIIIGGRRCHCSTFSVRLEPKPLQQLAAQTIDKHKTSVQWQYLPNKLIARLGYGLKFCDLALQQ